MDSTLPLKKEIHSFLEKRSIRPLKYIQYAEAIYFWPYAIKEYITNEVLSMAVDLWPGSRNEGIVELETYVGRTIVDFCLFCELIP